MPSLVGGGVPSLAGGSMKGEGCHEGWGFQDRGAMKDPPIGQQVGGTNSTGMHSCLSWVAMAIFSRKF